MTATPLLDLLELEGRLVPEGQRREDLLALVRQMVDSVAQAGKQLREYERQIYLKPAPNEGAEFQRDQAIHRLFQEWAAEAEEVLKRIAGVKSLELELDATAALRQELGFARARLTVTPEKLARGRSQARAGQTIPIEVLRNELQARRRA